MKGHLFRTGRGWAVFTVDGEVVELGAPDLSREEAATALSEIPDEGDTTWQIVNPGHRGTALTLNVSHTCNLRCVYCYAGGGTYGGFEGNMDPDTARIAVGDFERLPLGLSEVRFFGGEPLLNMPAIEAALTEILKSRADRELPKVGMVTNGTLVSDRLVNLWRQVGGTITVSLDGPKEVHDQLRRSPDGTGSYDKTVDGIKRLLDGLTSAYVRCEATYTGVHQRAGITRRQVLEFMRELGVPLGYVIDYMGTDQNLKCTGDPDEGRDFQLEMLNGLVSDDPHSDFDSINLVGRLVSRLYNHYICPVGVSAFLVSPSGTIYPCNLFVMPGFEMGSIFDPTWRDGERFRTVREKLRPATDRSTDPRCSECWNYHLCGGCPARHYFETNSLSLPSSASCDRQREAVENTLRWLSDISLDDKKWHRLKDNIRRLIWPDGLVNPQV